MIQQHHSGLIDLSPADAAVIAKLAKDRLGKKDLKEFKSTLSGGADFKKYQSDPVGFTTEILRETVPPDIKTMMESVRDNPITIARSANATGKTWGAARVALWFYLAFPNSQVITAAAPPFDNLSRLLWGQIGMLQHYHPKLFDAHSCKALSVKRHDLSFLIGRSIPMAGTDAQRQAKFSGDHAPFQLFIFDEGDAVPDPCYKGTESCMSGSMARLLIMFNPRAEAGEPFRMERDARANVVEISAFNHPNVIQGRDVIPGAVSCEKTVQRINRYCRKIVPGEVADDSCFRLPKYLEYVDAPRESGAGRYDPLEPGHYKVMEQVFWTLVLGRYPQQAEDQLISKEWVRAARDRWDLHVQQNGEMPPANSYGVQGVDVAEFGQDLSVICHRYGGYVEKLLWKNSMDPLEVGDWAADEALRRRIRQANVDGTGVGAGTAPQMVRRGIMAVSLKVATRPTAVSELGEFQILRDQLAWKCREWLRTDPWAMLPPDELLEEELATYTYAIRNGRVRVMPTEQIKDLLKRSPDRSMSLFFTFGDEVQGQASTGGQVSDKARQKASIRKQAMRV